MVHVAGVELSGIDGRARKVVSGIGARHDPTGAEGADQGHRLATSGKQIEQLIPYRALVDDEPGAALLGAQTQPDCLGTGRGVPHGL